MSKLVLEQTLIEVVPFEAEFRGVGKLLEKFLGNHTWLALLLQEAEDLVDLVRDDVPILVLLVFIGCLSLSLGLRVVFPIFFHLHFLSFSLYLSIILSFIGNRVSQLKGFAFVGEWGGFSIVGKDDWGVGEGLVAVLEQTLNVGLIFRLTHLSILLKIAGGFSHNHLGVLAEVDKVHLWGKVIRSGCWMVIWKGHRGGGRDGSEGEVGITIG